MGEIFARKGGRTHSYESRNSLQAVGKMTNPPRKASKRQSRYLSTLETRRLRTTIADLACHVDPNRNVPLALAIRLFPPPPFGCRTGLCCNGRYLYILFNYAPLLRKVSCTAKKWAQNFKRRCTSNSPMCGSLMQNRYHPDSMFAFAARKFTADSASFILSFFLYFFQCNLDLGH